MNQKIKVENMESSKGNTIANQFRIITDEGIYFQSYASVIAFIPRANPNAVELDEHYWNYSRTTSKYRSIFLGESTAETKAKINSGDYKLTNLN